MKNRFSWGKQFSGTPLADVVVGLALSSVLVAMTGTLWLYASRDLAVTAKYTELTSGHHIRAGVGHRVVRLSPQVAAAPTTPSRQWSGTTPIIIAATEALNP